FAVVHQEDAFRVPEVRRTVVLGSGADRIELADKESSLLLDGQKRVLFRTAALPLIGTHNLENAAMSAAAAVLAFPQIVVEKALPSFKAPRHRCEKVCEKNGVLYVDDSKGTNVAAAVTALRSVPGRKTVILGGQGKGETYELLAQTVREQAASAIVIGSEAPAICRALECAGCKNILRAAGMEEAVRLAAKNARPGETVLLSPACTSWDMYKNYGERGDHFAQLVRKLP
ncbi:MAG: UDP-N-acetylmuramoyl-L-alanine--D-glutamate ligase, partial [Pyramidobacter sp.]|nr:UDP-N-acetylmuramoyl-L-alanine--D-glutamate ligase [Pyramidobacter sp.]